MFETQLLGQLKDWHNEYCEISGKALPVPEAYFKFLARRLSALGFAVDDPDVVRIHDGESIRKVRITGKHGAQLLYSRVDGVGTGLILISNVLDEDRGKLTLLLEKMLRDGTIRDGVGAGEAQSPPPAS